MKILNLCLLVLFPIAWFAPLIRAGFLPIFGLDEISVITGLLSLWESDAALALIVTFFAVFAPLLGSPQLFGVGIPVALDGRDVQCGGRSTDGHYGDNRFCTLLVARYFLIQLLLAVR